MVRGRDFRYYFDTHGLPIQNIVGRNKNWIEYLNKSNENKKQIRREIETDIGDKRNR